jgi:hypothetical protein
MLVESLLVRRGREKFTILPPNGEGRNASVSFDHVLNQLFFCTMYTQKKRRNCTIFEIIYIFCCTVTEKYPSAFITAETKLSYDPLLIEMERGKKRFFQRRLKNLLSFSRNVFTRIY